MMVRSCHCFLSGTRNFLLEALKTDASRPSIFVNRECGLTRGKILLNSHLKLHHVTYSNRIGMAKASLPITDARLTSSWPLLCHGGASVLGCQSAANPKGDGMEGSDIEERYTRFRAPPQHLRQSTQVSLIMSFSWTLCPRMTSTRLV